MKVIDLFSGSKQDSVLGESEYSVPTVRDKSDIKPIFFQELYYSSVSKHHFAFLCDVSQELYFLHKLYTPFQRGGIFGKNDLLRNLDHVCESMFYYILEKIFWGYDYGNSYGKHEQTHEHSFQNNVVYSPAFHQLESFYHRFYTYGHFPWVVLLSVMHEYCRNGNNIWHFHNRSQIPFGSIYKPFYEVFLLSNYSPININVIELYKDFGGTNQ